MHQLVGILRAVTDMDHSRQLSWSFLTTAALECITTLYEVRPNHGTLIATLELGLLSVLYVLSRSTTVGPMRMVRDAAGVFIRDALIHEIIWPRVLRAIRSIARRHDVSLTRSENDWEVWDLLVTQIVLCKANHEAASRQRSALYHCHNPSVSLFLYA